MIKYLKIINKPGFTTVELMVTLIIASLFIVSGYQLYNAVTLQSGKAREMAEASNIGYEVLRNEGSEYVSTANPCATPAIISVSRSVPTLPGLGIVLKRCKPFTDNNIVMVTVTVRYGNTSPQKEVSHATYISN